MAPLELNGYTLGERQRHYNKHFKNILAKNDGSTLDKINSKDCDIDNFLKIDLACYNKNVDYVLDIYKCEDMLYVSRAIKRSTWLIKEEQYKNIINIEYLKTQLFPHMTTKAKNKLLFSIRLHLRDESRVEDFFNYIKKDNLTNALKWLPYCSLPFIEQTVEEHYEFIKIPLLKRLCEKYFKVLEIIALKNNWERNLEYDFEATKFLIFSHPEKYMDTVLSIRQYFIPQFGLRATKTAMKLCPDKITKNFNKMCGKIHLPTFVKYYKHEDLKDFLISQTEHATLKVISSSITTFKKYMPIEHRLEIVKTFCNTILKQPVLLNKNDSDIDELLSKCAVDSTTKSPGSLKNFGYHWYSLLPFKDAFPKIIAIIHTESLARYRNNLLKILLCCADKNIKNVQQLLQFYRDNHIKEAFIYKTEFLNNILSHTNPHKFDENTWNILNDLFCSVGVYEDSDKNIQNYINCVLVYNVLHGLKVPETIANKVDVDSMKFYRNNLNEAEKDLVFNYLYNHVLSKLQKQKLTDEVNFKNSVSTLETILKLLDDWDKDLCNYTSILSIIKNFAEINKANSGWDCDLAKLLVINNSWKKYLIEESLALFPSDELCLYALKHDPDFLKRHKNEILSIMFDGNNNMFNDLKHTFRKLRTYWSLSLAKEWADEYQRQLETPSTYKAVKGICVLLPTDPLLDIIKKYAPVESKIDINETMTPRLCLQKQIAMNMYSARSLLSLDTVLLYSKGDYLQYVRPSLNAILTNTSPIKSKENVSMLLKNGRVSLQKYNVKLATTKLNSDEIKPLLSSIWKSTKNISVRNVIFRKVFDLLIKEKETEMWELLKIFIDDLSKSSTGSSTIYKTLKKANETPISIRVNVYVKSYIYLSSLPFDPVCTVVLESLKWQIYQIVSEHLLTAKDEKSQMQSYEKVLVPFMENCKLDQFSTCIIDHLPKVLENNNTIPFKMFEAIQTKLEIKLSLEKDYVLLTKWGLITAFLKSLDNCLRKADDHDTHQSISDIFNSSETKNKWSNICTAMMPRFTNICIQTLKEHIELYSPTIYTLFSKVLNSIVDTLFEQNRSLLMKNLLSDENAVTHLVVIDMLPIRYDGSKEDDDIHQMILTQSPLNVKMYYNQKFEPEKNN
ncbi:uncharacterized protein ACR2FA_001978 [Aphomia sociella]